MSETNKAPEVTIKFQGVTAGEFKVDEANITIPEEAQPKVEGLIKNIYDAANEINSCHTTIDQLQGEIEILKLDAENRSDAKAIADAADELTTTRELATKLGFKSDAYQGKSASEIRRLVVADKFPDIKLDEKNDDFIVGCWTTLSSSVAREDGNKEKMRDLGDASQQANQGHAPAMSLRQKAQGNLKNLHLDKGEQLSERKLV